MSFHFNWNGLDNTAAEALRSLINRHLEAIRARSFPATRPNTVPVSPSCPDTAQAENTDHGTDCAVSVTHASCGASTTTSVHVELSSHDIDAGQCRHVESDAKTTTTPAPRQKDQGVPHCFIPIEPVSPSSRSTTTMSHRHSNDNSDNSIHSSAIRNAHNSLSSFTQNKTHAECRRDGVSAAVVDGSSACTSSSFAGGHSCSPVAESGKSNNTATDASEPCQSHTKQALVVERVYVSSLKWGVVSPFLELVSMRDALDMGDESAVEIKEADSRTCGPCSTNLPPITSTATATAIDNDTTPTSMLHARKACDRMSPVTSGPTDCSFVHMDSPPPSSTRATAEYLAAPLLRTRPTSPSTIETLAQPVAQMKQTKAHSTPSRATCCCCCCDGRRRGRISMRDAEVRDTASEYFGPGGLFVRLHMTYGGNMKLRLRVWMRYTIDFGPISLPVRMPLRVQVSNVDLDCYINANMIHNACRLWLEPGAMSRLPISRMDLSATFGERARGRHRCGDGMHSSRHSRPPNLHRTHVTHNHEPRDVEDSEDEHTGSSSCRSSSVDSEDEDEEEEEEDALTSSMDHFSLRGGVHRSDAEDGELFVESKEIRDFILAQLNTILQEKLMAPHYITIPLSSGVSAEDKLPEDGRQHDR